MFVTAQPAVDAPAPSKHVLALANRAVPVNKISKGELQRILLGEVIEWGRQKPVTVLLVDDRTLARVLKDVVGMSRGEYENHFFVKDYQQSPVVRPRLFPTLEAAVHALVATPGAIAIVEEELDFTVGGVKTLAIDSKLPQEDGYKL